MENVRKTGEVLGTLLHHHLDDHPHVGNVRGKGLFWGVRRPRVQQELQLKRVHVHLC